MRALLVVTVTVLVAAVGCEKKSTKRKPASPGTKTTPSPVVVNPEPAALPAPVKMLVGRWQSSQLCIELYPTGEFEMTRKGEGPKIVVFGSVTQHKIKPGLFELTLLPTAIRRHRWISKCRKNVVSAKLLKTASILQTEFTVGNSAVMRLRMLANNKVELCTTSCVTATGAPARLAGHWRQPASTKPWKPGFVIQLKLGDANATVGFAGANGAFHSAYGKRTISITAPGMFKLVVTPDRFAKRAMVLGMAVAAAAPLTFTVQRVKGGIKVCGAPGTCNTVPRRY